MRRSELPKGHAGRCFNILETLPRDDLIQAPEEELLSLAMGFQLQERKRVRLFARTDIYGHFIFAWCLRLKERFNTKLLRIFRDVLADAFNKQDIVFSTLF